VEDIIQKVDFEIVVSGIRNKLAGGIVLTGGGSSMKDITQLFNYFIGLEVHIGSPGQRLGKGMIDEVRNPMYATSIGLVLKGFELAQKHQHIELNNEIINHEEPVARVSDPFLDEVVIEQAPHQMEIGDTEIGKRSGFNLFTGSWLGGKSNLFRGLNDWMKEGDDFQDS
jgi:cell division ATPase FtsA